MMNLFRRGGGGSWIVAAIALLVSVVFVVEFRAARGPTEAKVAGDCAARVLGYCASHKEFFAAYGLIVPQGLPGKKVKAMKLPGAILEGLVERELLVAEAHKLGVGIGDDDLDVELTHGRAEVSLPVAIAPVLGARLGLCLPSNDRYSCSAEAPMVRLLPVRRHQDDRFDNKLYERVVRNVTNRGARQFREMQQREEIASRMRALIAGQVRVSREEGWEAYSRANSKAVVKYVILDRSWFGRYVADTSAAAIESWVNDNKEQVDSAYSTDKAKYSKDCPLVSEVVFPFAPDATDEQKSTLRTEADTAYRRISKDQEPFEVVARQMSQDESALVGGSIGCLDASYGPDVKELLDAIAGLKPGQISAVLETSHGFHILRLDGRLAESDVDVYGRMATGRRLAVRFLADEAMRKFAEGLIERAKAQGDLDKALEQQLSELFTLPNQQAGKKTSVGTRALEAEEAPKVETSPPFTIDGAPSLEFSAFSGVGSQVFALDKPGELVPAPVVLSRGLSVVMLSSKSPADRKEFETSASSTLASLREAKAHDALVNYVARLRKQASHQIEVDASLNDLKIRGVDD